MREMGGFFTTHEDEPTENVPVRHDSFKHHRRSIRMKGYDYASDGAYFVTVCTKIREYIRANPENWDRDPENLDYFPAR